MTMIEARLVYWMIQNWMIENKRTYGLPSHLNNNNNNNNATTKICKTYSFDVNSYMWKTSTKYICACSDVTRCLPFCENYYTQQNQVNNNYSAHWVLWKRVMFMGLQNWPPFMVYQTHYSYAIYFIMVHSKPVCKMPGPASTQVASSTIFSCRGVCIDWR